MLATPGRVAARRSAAPGVALLAALALPAAADAGRPAVPWGYLAEPTDQLAEPGWEPSVGILPGGGLYSGWWDTALRGGPRGGDLALRARRAKGGWTPVVEAERRDGDVRTHATWLLDEVAARPTAMLRLRVRNEGRVRRRAGVGLDLRHRAVAPRLGAAFQQGFRHRFLAPARTDVFGLYAQPGEDFRAGQRTTAEGDLVRRDGRVVAVVRGGTAEGRGATDRADGLAARARWRGTLGPGRSHELVVLLTMPPVSFDDPTGAEAVDALRAVDVDRHVARVQRRWRARVAAATLPRVPERRVDDALRAQLVELLQSRRPQVDGSAIQQVNALQYRSFWLRDAALQTVALDRSGLHEQARENLRFFGAWQRADGLFISRAGQLDGIGQALWAFGEHARLTGDTAWARAQAPALGRAVAWIARARAEDPLGLLPAGDPRDNELAQGHLAGDDAWALGGLRATVDLAALAGDAALQAAAHEQAEALALALRTAASAAAARTRDGAVPSVLAGATEGRDWGNLVLGWPDGLAPDDALVRRTLTRARRRGAEGLVRWGPALHTYLGFPVAQTRLRRGEQEATVAGLYAALAHTTGTHGAFETGLRPYRGRSVADNLAPHGAFAAHLLLLVRAMLVDDRPDGSVHVLSALPPAWVAPGARTTLPPTPTSAGPVGVDVRARRGGATVRVSAPAGRPVVLHAPPWAAGPATRRLTGPTTVRLRWARPVPRQSFAATAETLRSAYRRRGRTPPVGTP